MQKAYEKAYDKASSTKKLSWETPVTSLLPSFRLGDADTTRRVLVKDFEFVVGAGAKRTLVLRDSQHQYVFEEQ